MTGPAAQVFLHELLAVSARRVARKLDDEMILGIVNSNRRRAGLAPLSSVTPEMRAEAGDAASVPGDSMLLPKSSFADSPKNASATEARLLDAAKRF